MQQSPQQQQQCLKYQLKQNQMLLIQSQKQTLIQCIASILGLQSTKLHEIICKNLNKYLEQFSLPRKLAYIRKDVSIVDDYKKYPELINFVKITLEMVSQIYETKIILYSVNNYGLLTGLIINEKGYQQYLKIARINNNYYQVKDNLNPHAHSQHSSAKLNPSSSSQSHSYKYYEAFDIEHLPKNIQLKQSVNNNNIDSLPSLTKSFTYIPGSPVNRKQSSLVEVNNVIKSINIKAGDVQNKLSQSINNGNVSINVVNTVQATQNPTISQTTNNIPITIAPTTTNSIVSTPINLTKNTQQPQIQQQTQQTHQTQDHQQLFSNQQLTQSVKFGQQQQQNISQNINQNINLVQSLTLKNSINSLSSIGGMNSMNLQQTTIEDNNFMQHQQQEQQQQQQQQHDSNMFFGYYSQYYPSYMMGQNAGRTDAYNQNFSNLMNPQTQVPVPVSPTRNQNSIKRQNSTLQINQNERYTGRLKFFDQGKNYGFIIMDADESDIFVHCDDLQKAGISKQRVRCYKQSQGVIRFSFKVMSYFGKYKESRKAVQLIILDDGLMNHNINVGVNVTNMPSLYS